jgi:hypothetical protein
MSRGNFPEDLADSERSTEALEGADPEAGAFVLGIDLGRAHTRGRRRVNLQPHTQQRFACMKNCLRYSACGSDVVQRDQRAL